jgi:hypothetical protein
MPAGVHERGVGRHDVEDRERQHRVRPVERHAVPGAPASIMPNHVELRESEPVHQRHLIGSHRSEGVAGAIGEAERFRGIAIATQVGADRGEPCLGQQRSDPGPHGEVLWKAVQQQHRWSASANHTVNRDAVARLELAAFKFLEHCPPPSGARAPKTVAINDGALMESAPDHLDRIATLDAEAKAPALDGTVSGSLTVIAWAWRSLGRRSVKAM